MEKVILVYFSMQECTIHLGKLVLASQHVNTLPGKIVYPEEIFANIAFFFYGEMTMMADLSALRSVKQTKRKSVFVGQM